MAAVFVIISGIAACICYAETDYSPYAQGIIEYRLKQADAEDVQSFIDGYLTENAGSSEADWYIFALASWGGYDFASYQNSAERVLNEERLTSQDKLRIAIAYCNSGGDSLDVGAIIDENSGAQGIMSEIYGLILANMGDFSCATDDKEKLDSLLSRQLADGGWALSGSNSDTDVTAMALQALSAYRSDPVVAESIEKALARLSALQQSDGGYRSYGKANAESCAQVILALCQLGIDPLSDSRFVKNGNSAADALMMYRCESGGFSHLAGGTENMIATVQAYQAFSALDIFRNSGRGLYPLIQRNPVQTQEPAATTAATTNSMKQTSTVASSVTTAAAQTSLIVSSAQSQGTEDNLMASTTAETMTETHTTAITQTESDIITEASPKSDRTEISTETVITSAETTLSETVNMSSDDDAGGIGGDDIKRIALISIGALFAVSQLISACGKRFSVKSLLVSLGASAVCAGAVMLSDIQTPEEYYSRNVADVRQDSLTVTMSVSCEVIADKLGGDYIIIPETEYVLLEGDTAFSVLERVLAAKRIPLDYSGVMGYDAYVRGINNIYEMDYGEMSGWMFTVNGDFPDFGGASYKLNNGDCVEWKYTLETGRDIGMEEFEQ